MRLGKSFQVKRFRVNAFGQKFLGKKVLGEIVRSKVFSGGWIWANGRERLSPSSLTQKLTVQSRSSEQPSLIVDMIKGAAVNSAESAECRAAERR